MVFLILFSQSKIYAETDLAGFSWQKLSSYVTGRDIYGVAYNGTYFVAVGQKGLILNSSDGITWSKVVCGYEEDFVSVYVDVQKFIATTQSGRIFTSINGEEWCLLSQNVKATSSAAIDINNNVINAKCKVFGFVKANNIAIAVGEAGSIFYGTKKGNQVLKQDVLTTQSDVMDKLNNSVVLCVGSSKLYADNILVDKDFPAPYTQKVKNQDVIYVPVDAVTKAIGGKFMYDAKLTTSTIYFQNTSLKMIVGKNNVVLNGKNTNTKYPAIMKDNVVFVPLVLFEFLGKQCFENNKLVVISNIKNVLDASNDEKIIEGIISLCNSSTNETISLFAELKKVLIKLGRENSDYSTAISYYTQANSIEESSDVYAYLACASHNQYSPQDSSQYIYQEPLVEAKRYVDQGLNLNCENSALYVELMSIYCCYGWFDKATQSIEKAVELEHNKDKFNRQFGELEYFKENYEEAIVYFDKVLEKEPTNYSVYLFRCDSLIELKKYQEAINWYNKCFQFASKDQYAYLFSQKGFCLYELHKYSKAVTQFDNALKLSPKNEVILENKADAFYKLGNYELAASIYKEIINIDYLSCGVYEKYADSLANLGKNDEAIKGYDDALKYMFSYDECLEEVFKKKVELLIKLKKYDLLISSCDSFLNDREYNTTIVYYYKAIGYCGQGKLDQALSFVSKAINDDKHYRKIVKYDNRFNALNGMSDYQKIVSEASIFIDETFGVNDVNYFKGSTFNGIVFELDDTIGSSIEDKYIKDLAISTFTEILNVGFADKQSALQHGIYEKSPLMESYSDTNQNLYMKLNVHLSDPKIVMYGNYEDRAKYVIVSTKCNWNLGAENDETICYFLLINDNGSWKYYMRLI